jgi:hypothetical protein
MDKASTFFVALYLYGKSLLTNNFKSKTFLSRSYISFALTPPSLGRSSHYHGWQSLRLAFFVARFVRHYGQYIVDFATDYPGHGIPGEVELHMPGFQTLKIVAHFPDATGPTQHYIARQIADQFGPHGNRQINMPKDFVLVPNNDLALADA